MAEAEALHTNKMWKVKLIGFIGLSSSTGIYIAYLLFLENIRQVVLHDSLNIVPCSSPWIDIFVDNLFEFSVIANVLVVVAWNKWLLLPWLIVYFINIGVLTCLAIVTFIVPVNSGQIPEGFSTRYLGIPLLLVDFLLVYLWLVVNSEFQSSKPSSSSAATSVSDAAADNYGIRMVVRVCNGVLALFSSVVLVATYSSFVETIQKFVQKFLELSNDTIKVIMTIFCVVTIATNLLSVIGTGGAKWRRGFMVPWLILYGFVIIFLVGVHQWFTTLCWIEEKVYGMTITRLALFGFVLVRCRSRHEM